MIKLIASDMDETLLDGDGRLPAGFDACMAELKARQVLFMPASGRQYASLLRLFPEYRQDFIFSAENGCLVMYQGQELFSSILPTGLVRDLLTTAAAIPQAYPVVCSKSTAYVLPHWKPYLPRMKKYFLNCTVIDDFSAIRENIIEIALCDCEGSDAIHSIYPHIQHLAPHFHLSLSTPSWIDIKNPGIHKGTALRQVQQRLGLRADECASFGDYLNDCEMLDAAYYSFAVENAHPELMHHARFRARSNRQNGVLTAIQELKQRQLL